MKLLDRYILKSFFKNYLISFMVLVGLYIALDMVFSFGDMTETPAGEALSVPRLLFDIGDYYFYQTFVFFVQLSGMITVVAAAFTLMRMSRFNELTALLASGISLQRVGLWIILAGAFLNIVLVPIDQELVIPQMIPKLIRKHEELHLPTPRHYSVWAMQDNGGGVLFAARYTPPGTDVAAHIDIMDVIFENEHHMPTGKLAADSADWDAKTQSWKLTNGVYTRVLQPHESHFSGPTTAPAPIYKSDITPDEIGIWRGGEFVELLPFTRLTRMLYDMSRQKNYGANQLLRAWNMRLTQPAVNVILLLLAIPAVLTREPGRLKFAAARCMVFSGACMGTAFLTNQLALSPPADPSYAQHWPAIMSGLPIVLFGPLAAWAMTRVKT